MRSSCRPQSELRPPLMGLAPPYGFATHCSGHCTTCAAQGIKGPCWFGVILIFLRIIYGSPLWQLKHRARVAQVSPFKGASQDTCWQQPCSTWASVLVGSPAFRRGFTSLSSPGKVPRLLSNWATWSTACVSPRLFLWVLALRPYFPGGTLNALASPPEGSTLRAVSVHRLGRGVQGYLQICCSQQILNSKVKMKNAKWQFKIQNCCGHEHFCRALHIAMQFGLYHIAFCDSYV